MVKGAALGEMTGVQVRAGGCLFHRQSSLWCDVSCYYSDKTILRQREDDFEKTKNVLCTICALSKCPLEN